MDTVDGGPPRPPAGLSSAQQKIEGGTPVPGRAVPPLKATGVSFKQSFSSSLTATKGRITPLAKRLSRALHSRAETALSFDEDLKK